MTSLSPRSPTSALHLALLGFAFNASAQAADPVPAAPAASSIATPLPAVRVTSQRAPAEQAGGPVEGYIARRSNTATRSDAALAEVPQAISVITRDFLDDQGAVGAQEALRYTSGVATDLYGARNTTEHFLIRGSKATTLVNGLRLPQNWFADPLDELFAYERVEVLRGPSSVIAGQAGPGGVVNLISKRPQTATHHEIAVQFGHRGRKQIAVDSTGPVGTSDTVSYRVVALANDIGSQVDHADSQRQLFAPAITWAPSARTRVTAYAEYQRDHNGNNDAFLPVTGTLVPGPNGFIPDSRFVSEPGWDGNTGRRLRVGYEVQLPLAADWSLRHNLRHDDVDRVLKSMYTAWWDGFVDSNGVPDANGTYLGRYWGVNRGRTRSTSTDLSAEGRFDTGAVRHAVVVGADLLRYTREDRYWEDLATPLDVYSPVYGTFTPPALLDDAVASHSRPRVRQLGIFAMDRLRVGRWAVSLGLRHDRASTATPSTTQDASAWTKNLGAVYLADGGWSPYVSYAESFETQGASTLGVVFDPKRGEQYEAGVKWAPADSRMHATVSLFRLQEKNRLKTDPMNPMNQIESDPVTTAGLEVEFAANLRHWDLKASYTRLSAKDDASGQRVAFAPEQSATVWALNRFGWAGLPLLRAGLGLRYVGATSNGTGTVSVPSVALIDALLGWDAGDWRVALNVANLADKAFVSTCDPSEYCWYGQRRSVKLSASYRF